MLKPITIHSFIAEQEKIQKYEEKFLTTKVDDSLRKLGKEILKDAPLLKAHGSDLLTRVKEPLDKFAEEKKRSEKSGYNALQRFAFRIAGVFKRGVFATKGEAAEKLSKKINVVVKKLEGEDSGGLMARVANIQRDYREPYKSIYKKELLSLSENNFEKLFSSSPVLNTEEVAKVFSGYSYDVDGSDPKKPVTRDFMNKLAEIKPVILVSKDMLADHLTASVVNQIATNIVNLSEEKFLECILELQKVSSETSDHISYTSGKIFNKIIEMGSDNQKEIIRKNGIEF